MNTDPDPGSKINADPDPGLTFDWARKSKILHAVLRIRDVHPGSCGFLPLKKAFVPSYICFWQLRILIRYPVPFWPIPDQRYRG
jgi:hypothetical protein